MNKLEKQLARAEKILTDIKDSDFLLTTQEADLLASTLILLCKLELVVLKRTYKEIIANKAFPSLKEIVE